MANPTVKATIPQAAFVKSALWVSPDVVGGSGAWDAQTSTRYVPWGTLSSTALGSTGINGLSAPGGTNCGIDLGLAQLHSTTPFDVSGSELTIVVCGSADATTLGRFFQNQNGYSPNEGWSLGSDSTYMSGKISPLTSPSSSGGSVTTSEIAVYAMTYDGANCKLYRNGTQVGTIASTGNLSYNTTGERRAALFNYYQSRAVNAIAQKIFGAIVYNKALSAAELQTFGTSNTAIVEGSFHSAAFDFGGGGASATFTITTDDATFSGNGKVSPIVSFTAVAADATFSGWASSSISATFTATTEDAAFSGTAVGDTSSGSLTTPVLKNNTGTVLASETGATAYVYNPTTGALVVKKTSQTTNGLGVMVITDPLIIATTMYRVVVVLGSGAEGMEKLTAA